MTDFSFVTPRLATGAAISSPADVAALVQAGITHCIDCRAEFDDGPLLAGSGMSYLYAPTADDGQHPKPASWFNAGLVFALPALAQPHSRVYAHCMAGRNRGPSMAVAIMMALGWGEAAARAAILAVRPQATIAYADDAAAAVAALGYQ